MFHDSTLLVALFEDIFSPSAGSLFIFKKNFMYSFAVWKLLNVTRPHVFYV